MLSRRIVMFTLFTKKSYNYHSFPFVETAFSLRFPPYKKNRTNERDFPLADTATFCNVLI